MDAHRPELSGAVRKDRAIRDGPVAIFANYTPIRSSLYLVAGLVIIFTYQRGAVATVRFPNAWVAGIGLLKFNPSEIKQSPRTDSIRRLLSWSSRSVVTRHQRPEFVNVHAPSPESLSSKGRAASFLAAS